MQAFFPGSSAEMRGYYVPQKHRSHLPTKRKEYKGEVQLINEMYNENVAVCYIGAY